MFVNITLQNKAMTIPKVTFGMIVLNGEPFIGYNLRAIYPYAHQIIVVEGAVPASRVNATPDGHSVDTTIETIKRFQREEDPDEKLVLVTAEIAGKPDGFWTEKDEMSEAYANKTTGNILWQVDVDEFYLPEDINKIIELFASDDKIKTASFTTLYFWGGPTFIMDGFSFRTTDQIVHRIFRWNKRFQYISHRPPTVIDENFINLRDLGYLSHVHTANMGIVMYHYDMLLPLQAERKSQYYRNVDWHSLEGSRILDWKSKVYDQLLHPFHIYSVYTHFSWLKRFKGNHPPIIQEMMEDIKCGKWPSISLRKTDDIERMLNGLSFRLSLPLVKAIVMAQVVIYKIKIFLRTQLMKTMLWRTIQWFRGRT